MQGCSFNINTFASRGAYNLKPLSFSGAEATALFVAARVLLEQKGFPHREDLEAALQKIVAVIREKEQQDYVPTYGSIESILSDHWLFTCFQVY
ncbi:hypothetical protein [Thermincola ferriacetica]|uniref:hypothetical protein n=1 Tax=Thermincola ferriacetica TaxID=281456 RepID=UPI0006892B5B|nr:hypothetical protein [Thermincola ferriacetica]